MNDYAMKVAVRFGFFEYWSYRLGSWPLLLGVVLLYRTWGTDYLWPSVIATALVSPLGPVASMPVVLPVVFAVRWIGSGTLPDRFSHNLLGLIFLIATGWIVAVLMMTF